MQSFKNQMVSRENCPVLLGPKERLNALHWSQNVTLENLEFIDCQFIGEGLATYGAPAFRSTARNLRLANCKTNSFSATGAIFDEVIVDGLRLSRAPAILSGCAFRRVTLTGYCGGFIFNRNVSHGDHERNVAFDASNRLFYGNVDWALDIRTINTAGLEFRGSIPARLIRRNPEEHFVITRDVAQSGDWKQYEPHGSFQIAISLFLDSGSDDNVIVAAKRSRHFKEEVEYLHRLKAAGLVT